MKKILFILLATIQLLNGFSQGKINQTNFQLALKYYNQREYEKAAPLFKELFDVSRSNNYFKYYYTCLIQLKDYDKAEKEVIREIKKSKNDEPEFYVFWGYLNKVMKNNEEAQEKYEKAFKMIPENRAGYLNTANTFLQFGEYEMAEKVYLQGRKNLKNDRFTYELARVYSYLRNHEQMMEEYLDFVKEDEKNLKRIESSLSAAMYRDVNNGLRDKFKNIILKRIQSEPQIIGYNRLLIWFFLQERKFSSALRQTIAIDRRTGNEDLQIVNLAKMALNNRDYTEAKNAYEYLLKKGESNPYYLQSYIQNLHCSYFYYIKEEKDNLTLGEKLLNELKTGIDYLGYSPNSYPLLIEYADILAFYFNRPEEAIEVLKKGLTIKLLKTNEIGELKTKLADVYVFNDDPWEAMLIYSQVIDALKDNELGDEAKLKKAKLGYYLGNFSWAQAQLDVLKASTSKLTANDAFELSLLISNNSALDTTDFPLQLFAKADLLFFRKKDSLAMVKLDSIEELFPYHSLVDDILFRKVKNDIGNNNYIEAAKNLEQIVTDFSYETLADDALFLLAELNQFHLNNPEKAQELYKNMLVNYPGSIYVSDSRKRFRELRGDPVEEDEAKQPEENPEELFFEGIEIR